MTVEVAKFGLSSGAAGVRSAGRQAQQLGRSFGQSFKRGTQGIAKPKIAAPTMGNFRAGQAGSYMGQNRKPLSYGLATGVGGTLAAKRDVGTGVAVGKRHVEYAHAVAKGPKLDALARLLKPRKVAPPPQPKPYQSVTNVRPGGRMYGNVQGIGKGVLRQGTKPFLARVTPAAGRNHARVVTGTTMRKRAYDPENRRSARTGAAGGVTTAAGLGLAGYGGREIYVTGAPAMSKLPNFPVEQARPMREGNTYRGGPNAGKQRKERRVAEQEHVSRRAVESDKAAARRKLQLKAQEAISQHNSGKHPRGRFVSGRGAGALAAGTALIGAGAGLHRRASEPRWS